MIHLGWNKIEKKTNKTWTEITYSADPLNRHFRDIDNFIEKIK